MQRKSLVLAASLLVASLSLPVMADEMDGASYEVTITNLTRGTLFTPALLVSHAQGVSLFQEGEAASNELMQLAEGGATQPLQDALYATGKAYDAATSGPILPGKSVTLQVHINRHAHHLSLASMMLPTNDGFIALNGIEGPARDKDAVVYLPGYDAGTEMNDELCAHIPGPQCGGEGVSASAGEGYVHVHNGIRGHGDLSARDYDWKNPVAKVSIRYVR